MSPKVNILVATYNGEKYLAESFSIVCLHRLILIFKFSFLMTVLQTKLTKSSNNIQKKV